MPRYSLVTFTGPQGRTATLLGLNPLVIGVPAGPNTVQRARKALYGLYGAQGRLQVTSVQPY